jgi:arylsulfatase
LGEGEVRFTVPWDSLTPQQKKFQQDKMTIHAAMIERMDKETGRIIAQLEEMDALDNTLVIVLSDNGASAEIMVRDDGHDPDAKPGSADTYLCLGPGWSTMCNTPFRKHKTWVHEGGSCSPFIVHWPKGIAARGELRNTHAHITDIVPTILDLTGISADSLNLEVAFAGQSLKPLLKKDTIWEHPVWYYHEGNRAIRNGDWKLVAVRDSAWELYNIRQDRTETNNRADSYQEKVMELEKQWNKLLGDIRDVAPRISDANKKVKLTTKNIE